MEPTEIKAVRAFEILDSRGNPTLQAEVTLADGTRGRAAVPSGASTGRHEAHEKRDGDPGRYGGRGVRGAVAAVEGPIAERLLGRRAEEQAALDEALCRLDGTPNKENLGANAILGASLALCHAAAASRGLPLWAYLAEMTGQTPTLPRPMLNIINGGAHAKNGIEIQEFMILPLGAPSFAEGLERAVRVTRALERLLEERGLFCGVGDEGGFAPSLPRDEDALDLLMEATERAGFTPGGEIGFALDAAASDWRVENGFYRSPKQNQLRSPEALLDYWEGLVERYPILSLEDPAGEDDWELWKALTERLGGRVQLVGDDLFVTQEARLRQGFASHAANAVLIKPNQVGTLTETLSTIALAKKERFGVVVSHRSGETEDSTIADLAVGCGAGQIKTGAPCRGERTAKYNRLLRIEAELRER